MRFVGVDLHKQTITVAVVEASRKLITRKRFSNLMSAEIISFLKSLGEFELTVEATASYEWFVQLVEPFASRVVLAHPGKLRRPSVVGFGGVGRPAPNKGVICSSALGFRARIPGCAEIFKPGTTRKTVRDGHDPHLASERLSRTSRSTRLTLSWPTPRNTNLVHSL